MTGAVGAAALRHGRPLLDHGGRRAGRGRRGRDRRTGTATRSGRASRPWHATLLTRLVRRAVAGEPLAVHGDGTRACRFLDVADAVDALLALLAHPGAAGAEFDIAGTEEITVMALAERTLARSGGASVYQPLPVVVDRVPHEHWPRPAARPLDTAPLSALTGWRPARGLDAVLDAAIARARSRGARRAAGAASAPAVAGRARRG